VAAVILAITIPLACCCWPLSMMGAVAASIIAHPARRAARERGESSMAADLVFWLGIVMAVIFLFMGIANFIYILMNPDAVEKMFGDLFGG